MLRKIFPKKKPSQWELRRLDAALNEAVHAGDVRQAKRLLRQGADISSSPMGEPSYLHIAAGEGKADMVRFLVKEGMDIDKSDLFAHGATPLHMAVKNGNYETAQALADEGADLDKSDILNPSALYSAVMRSDRKMAEILLDAGANVDAKVFKGLTSLHLAINMTNVEMVKMLLGRGANIRIPDRKGERPIDMEKARANPEIYAAILSVVSGKHAGRIKALRRRKSGPAR